MHVEAVALKFFVKCSATSLHLHLHLNVIIGSIPTSPSSELLTIINAIYDHDCDNESYNHHRYHHHHPHHQKQSIFIIYSFLSSSSLPVPFKLPSSNGCHIVATTLD